MAADDELPTSGDPAVQGDVSADLAVPGPDQPAELPDWHELPRAVRTSLIAIAARTLGELPPDQVPSALAPVARFTPGKRARLGAAPLARSLQRDPGFRAMVAQHLPHADAAQDAVTAAARAYLLHLPEAIELLDEASRADEITALRARVVELTVTVERLTGQLARSAEQQKPGQRNGSAAQETPSDADHEELERLRRRLREQGTRVRAAEQAAQAAIHQATQRITEAEARAERERASAESWRARADRESQRADAARQTLDSVRDRAGAERAAKDRRIDLLLGTVEQAAAGLRREWQLTTGGPDPADVVARRLPSVAASAARTADPSLLIGWLGLPGAHLIVDGYNVTKTGFGELSLADQRDRLTRSLAALAARTGAEITVVFDGAAVVVTPPSARGVRVLFSPPGVIADDVIRQLAKAEPTGRVVVVVSSDREVADGVRRFGARAVPSPVLLAILG